MRRAGRSVASCMSLFMWSTMRICVSYYLYDNLFGIGPIWYSSTNYNLSILSSCAISKTFVAIFISTFFYFTKFDKFCFPLCTTFHSIVLNGSGNIFGHRILSTPECTYLLFPPMKRSEFPIHFRIPELGMLEWSRGTRSAIESS